MDKYNSRTVSNVAGYRQVSQNGRNYLIIPAVPVREQVMKNYFVPASELTFAPMWNGTPITIRHPKRNSGSANVPQPDVAVIGRFYNAEWNETEKKLSGEYWIDVDEAMRYVEGQYILNSVYNNHVLETSTGYYADEEEVSGEFGGRSYSTIHHNLRPDHIAILVDEIGACSVADGCGVNRNSLVYQLHINSELYENGGKGSGDFGHLGRPGQVGGSRSKATRKQDPHGTGKKLTGGVNAYYVSSKDRADKYRNGFKGSASLMSKAKAETLFESMTRGGFDPVIFEIKLKQGDPYNKLTSSSIVVPSVSSTAIHEIDIDTLKKRKTTTFKNSIGEEDCDCPTLNAENESMKDRIEKIQSGFYHEFMQPQASMYIEDIFDGYVIVQQGEQLYKCHYRLGTDGEPIFDEKDQWTSVEEQYVEQNEDLQTNANGGFLVTDKDGGKHLPTTQDGKLSHRLMGAAWAALHGGYRGQKYEGPDKAKAIAKLKALYAREKMSVPSTNSAVTTNVVATDAPAGLKSLYERVYTKALKGSAKGDKEKAAKIAWGAVKQAGWVQDGEGKWHKKGEHAAKGTTTTMSKNSSKEKHMAKLSVSSVLDMLRGKGVEVQVNNEDELEENLELELDGEEEDKEEVTTPAPVSQFSDGEIASLKKLASMDWTKVNSLFDKLPSVLEMAQNAETEKTARKAEVIGMIMNSSSNTFSKEELEGMALPVLTKLNAQFNVSYAGMSGGVYLNNATDEEGLGLPSISFAKE